MKLGIALPVDIPGVSGDVLIDWLNRINGGPFETVAVVDEIVSANYESLVILSAAAALTHSARLMSAVIAGPTRNTALLAKQAASIDALSGGRLSLGLGVGELVDDFSVAGVDLRGRGERFDEQITQMKRIWAGEAVVESGQPIGPVSVQAGGPELLLGGWAPRAMERIGRLADGYVGAVLAEEMISDEQYRVAEQSWRDHGRPGNPRFVQNVNFALGDGADEAFDAYLAVSYAGSPDYHLQAIRDVTPRTAHDVRQMIERIESTGADELIFHPVSADIEQMERLEQIVG